jgi:hypothetical protein
MDCEHLIKNLVQCDGFSTCIECGCVVDARPEFLNGIDNYVEPLQICFYRRSKRFEDMLRKMVNPTPEKKDTDVIERYLNSGTRFNSITEFVVSLKGSGIKDKRYQSLHLFSKLFVDDYKTVEPLSDGELKLCVNMFKDVEYRFLKRTENIPFFNYNWLLSKLLHFMKITQYDPFLKKIKCKKRNEYYERMFNSLCKEKQDPGDLSNLKTIGAIEGRQLTNLFRSINAQRQQQHDSLDNDCIYSKTENVQ